MLTRVCFAPSFRNAKHELRELWSRYPQFRKSSDGPCRPPSYHRDAGDYQRRYSPAIVNENVGYSLEIAPGICDSISDRRSDARPAAAEEITLQPSSRARRAGYFYFILSRTFGLSTRIYIATIRALLLLRGACKVMKWEESDVGRQRHT